MTLQETGMESASLPATQGRAPYDLPVHLVPHAFVRVHRRRGNERALKPSKKLTKSGSSMHVDIINAPVPSAWASVCPTLVRVTRATAMAVAQGVLLIEAPAMVNAVGARPSPPQNAKFEIRRSHGKLYVQDQVQDMLPTAIPSALLRRR